MTQPLDFTTAGRQKVAPLPQNEPKPPLKERPQVSRGGQPPPRLPLVIAAAAVVLLVVVIGGFVLFGRSSKKAQGGNPATFARYCELSRQFNTLAPAAGSSNATSSAYDQFVREMGPTLQEMQVDAPVSIHSVVAATIVAVRQAAQGDIAGVRTSGFLADRARINDYQAKSCLLSGGGGPAVD